MATSAVAPRGVPSPGGVRGLDLRFGAECGVVLIHPDTKLEHLEQLENVGKKNCK